MSTNDVLLTGSDTDYDLAGLLVLAGLYGLVTLYSALKLYRALPVGGKFRPLQVLLVLALVTLVLRLVWIVYCTATSEDQLAAFLAVMPHIAMDGLGSALCYFW